MSWHEWDQDDLILRLRIQPKASRDAFVAPYGDAYKITLTAPPQDGKANKHLISFLAKKFSLPKSSVTLVTGAKSRSKTIRLQSPKLLPNPPFD